MPDHVQLLNNLQLPVAGVAFAIGAQQLTNLRWAPHRASARLLAAASLCVALVLVTNWVTLVRMSTGDADTWMFLRAVALAILMMSTLALVRALLQKAWSPWLAIVITVLLLARLVLWATTDLVFTHRYRDGLPVYGPLLIPITVTLLVLLVGYLPTLLSKSRTHRERVAVSVGGAGSVVLAIWSVIASNPWQSELLGGYLTLPGLAGIAVALWLRQDHNEYAAQQFAQRQRALAEFSQVALGTNTPDLDRAAMELLAEQLSRAAEADPKNDDFRGTVAQVWSAASERARAREALRRHATFDDLTTLPNRSEISARLDQALTSAATTGRSIAVAYADLNRFGTVNETYGLTLGDAVLRAVAERLRRVCGPCDEIGRVGSDEFALVCADADGQDTPEGLVMRVQEALRQPVLIQEHDVRLGVTVGVARADPQDPPVTAEALLRDAVTAMRHAKRHGTATSRFTPAFRAAALSRARLEHQLVGAVSRGEILVYYQPIVKPGTGAITGFESLARWRQGSDLVQPAEWIPIAEDTGLIHEIGEHVLVTAVSQVEDWHALGHRVSLSVNVSAPQLGTTRLKRAVRSALKHLPTRHLTLEITESLALDENARQELAHLQSLGARTALDDFGTGFSALAAVATLPINTIKIDRALTSLLDENSGETIIAATLTMARALNMTVVAEGVETQAHHAALTRLGCDFTQGYFYSRPVAADDALRLLANQTDHHD